MALPDLNETTAAPGTPLRAYDITYTPEMIKRVLDLTGETLDAYTYDGVLHVPPGVLLSAYGRLIHETFHYTAGVHTSSQVEFIRVPRAGEPLRVTGEVVRLTERNGDKYVTFTVVHSTEDGERLCANEHTSIYALRPRTPSAS